jgi:hypothetical protein
MFVLVKIIIQYQIGCSYIKSAEEMYDASAAVLTKGLLNYKPAG